MKFYVYVCVECGHKIARTQKVHSGQYIDDVRVQVRKSEFRMEVLSGTPVDDDDAKPSKAKPNLSNLFLCQNVFCRASAYFGSFNFFGLEHVFWFVVLVCLCSFNFFVLQHVFPVFCEHVSLQCVPREGL